VTGQPSSQQAPPAYQQPASQYLTGGGPPGGGHPGRAGYSLWSFTPSFSAAIFGTTFYLLTAIATSIQLVHYRTWYLQLVPKAAIGAATAAAVRVHSVLHPSAQLAFIIQQTIFQVVPTLLGVMTIVTFSRLVWWIAPGGKRKQSTLLLPPSMLSATWAGLLFIPDAVKAVGGTLGRPKPGTAPDPASLLNRAQSVAWATQFS
jgi:hypothetical protein